MISVESNEQPTRILAIETSCDETAAAVVADGTRIMSNVIASQTDLHAQYGGVYPEVASRRHVEVIYAVVEEAMREAMSGHVDPPIPAEPRGLELYGQAV